MTNIDPLDHDGDGKRGGSVPRRGRPPKDPDMVTVEVTKRGDGKVHTGEGVDIETGQDAVYEKGDTFRVAKAIADELEDKGYVIIR